jgi:hypothetical protein
MSLAALSRARRHARFSIFPTATTCYSWVVEAAGRRPFVGLRLGSLSEHGPASARLPLVVVRHQDEDVGQPGAGS